MSTRKPSQPLALSTPAPDAEMGAQLTAQYHKAVGAMPEILRFGAMMIRLREHLSKGAVAHRGQQKLPTGMHAKDGGVKGWLERHAPEVKRQTAQRFEDVTLAIVGEYPKLVGAAVAKQFALQDLAVADPAALPEAARKKQEALFAYVSGTSQKSWLDKLRPPKKTGGDSRVPCPSCHKPIKSGLEKCPHCDATIGAPYDPNAAIEVARDLLLIPLRQVAMRWSEMEDKAPMWTHLPTAELAEIDGLLMDLRADLKKALKKEGK